MVHSNGTRFESQRFRMDFTGSTKYSGFSADVRRVSAGGEDAARRAMPTRRVLARSLWLAATIRIGPSPRLWFPGEIVDAGGQSGAGRFELLLCWSATGAGPWTTCIGLTSSGHSGKSPTEVCGAWRRRIRKRGADRE